MINLLPYKNTLTKDYMSIMPIYTVYLMDFISFKNYNGEYIPKEFHNGPELNHAKTKTIELLKKIKEGSSLYYSHGGFSMGK